MTFLCSKVVVQLYARFADRDMFMRYEWGLAVGHKYTHPDATKANEKILASQIPSRVEREPNQQTRTAESSSQPTTVTSPPHSANPNRELSEVNQGTNNLEPGVSIPKAIRDTCADGGGSECDGEGERESDTESWVGDDQDYFSDPERDSEEEREAALFGD